VSRTIFTFTTSLFSASCVLLAIGDFTAHDSVPTFFTLEDDGSSSVAPEKVPL
jgi:hypothetical protein